MATGEPWTDADDRYLREHYPAEGAKPVATFLCRSKGAIFNRASKLGVQRIIKLKRQKFICEHCGDAFWRQPSRSAHGRAKHCSKECQYAAMRERPSTAPGEFRECLCCGTEFWIARYKLDNKKGAGKYCSRKCRDQHRIGENHPQYLNGSAQESRGPHYQANRRAARARDNHSCCECGLTAEKSIERYGHPLHIHHVKPFRWFGSPEAADNTGNLITLCCKCHRKADIALQRRERKARERAHRQPQLLETR